MLESRVLRNSNEFNIPHGFDYGYEAMYIGVNLILMHDYRLSFDVNVTEGDDIEVLIVTRKNFEGWKRNEEVSNYYLKKQRRINYTFTPSLSDSYVLILNNRYSDITKRISGTDTYLEGRGSGIDSGNGSWEQ